MVYHTAGFHNVEPAVFLDMTISEMHTYIGGIDRERKLSAEYDFTVADKLNHILGRYVMIAFNEPSKYPQQPLLTKNVITQHDEMTNDQMVVALKSWMGVMGGKEEIDG